MHEDDVDVSFHAIAAAGHSLYQLARVVPIAPQLGMEDHSHSADGGLFPVDVCRYLPLDGQDAHDTGYGSIRDRHVEHFHPALPVYALRGTGLRPTGTAHIAYLFI